MLHSSCTNGTPKNGFLTKKQIVEHERCVQQNLQMTNHLKEDLLDESVKIHKHALLTLLPFTKYASPNFLERNINRRMPLLVDLVKVNSFSSDDYIIMKHPETTFSNQPKDQAKKFSASLTALKRNNVLTRQSNDQWRCLSSTLPAKLLQTETLHTVIAGPRLFFQAPCERTWSDF